MWCTIRTEGWVQWLTPIIPAIPEANIVKVTVQGQPRKKVSKTPSEQIKWTWVYPPVIPATWEAEVEGSRPRSSWAKMQDPIWKITKAERTRGGAHVVEHLPSKALSSNPNTIKKEKQGHSPYTTVPCQNVHKHPSTPRKQPEKSKWRHIMQNDFKGHRRKQRLWKLFLE
jgi:hypothetical protein